MLKLKEQIGLHRGELDTSLEAVQVSQMQSVSFGLYVSRAARPQVSTDGTNMTTHLHTMCGIFCLRSHCAPS
jgi:hypothetical protein